MSGRQTGRIAFFFCAGFEVKSSRGRVCSFAWGLVTHSAAVSWLQLSYFGDLSNTIQTHVNLLSTLTMSTSSHPTSTESSARADSPRGGLALRPATRSRLGASAGRTMAEELRDQLAAALEAKRADGALTQQEAELLRTLTHPPLPREWLAGSQARVDASEPTWAERAAGGPRQAAGAAGPWQGAWQQGWGDWSWQSGWGDWPWQSWAAAPRWGGWGSAWQEQGPVPLRAGPKGKGGAPAPAQGKGRGKGKGNARHGATDAAAAKRELAQFLQLHGDFTFRPRPAPPAEILTVYDELYEGSLGLYKHMARHMRTPAALAILHQEILPEMARESHWRVDKQNHVEKNRRDSRELGASRSSRSSVSRASGWTSRTFGT